MCWCLCLLLCCRNDPRGVSPDHGIARIISGRDDAACAYRSAVADVRAFENDGIRSDQYILTNFYRTVFDHGRIEFSVDPAFGNDAVKVMVINTRVHAE